MTTYITYIDTFSISYHFWDIWLQSFQGLTLTFRGHLKSKIFSSFESPDMTYYLTSLDNFSLSRTVFEIFDFKVLFDLNESRYVQLVDMLTPAPPFPPLPAPIWKMLSFQPEKTPTKTPQAEISGRKLHMPKPLESVLQFFLPLPFPLPLSPPLQIKLGGPSQ